jgi:hypothetical protein
MNAPWQNPRALRVPVRIPLRLRLLRSPAGEKPETDFHNGNNFMSNLSRTGFFLTTKNYFEVGSALEVEFPIENIEEVIRAEVEVVRANNQNYPSQGRFEYGLKFTGMHPHFREVLGGYLSAFGA